MQLLRQNKEYNCAVYAVNMLMRMYGIEKTATEIDLNTTEENGTSHDSIADYFYEACIYEYNAHLSSVKLPAIVSYQFCDGKECEGHYSVLMCVTSKKVTLYNPAYGEIEVIDKKKFVENWYSKRYGKRWYLALV